MGEIELLVHLADSHAEVWGNRIQLEQVVVNLLMNASDALKGAAFKRVTITVEADEDRHVVTVTDTGHGIAPEALPVFSIPSTRRKKWVMGRDSGCPLSMASSRTMAVLCRRAPSLVRVPHLNCDCP